MFGGHFFPINLFVYLVKSEIGLVRFCDIDFHSSVFYSGFFATVVRDNRPVLAVPFGDHFGSIIFFFWI